MKTIQQFFKKNEEEILPDYTGLLKITIGVFTLILVVCAFHLFQVVL